MAFDKTWAETEPLGTRDANLVDDYIRETRYAFRERMAVDHAFYTDESGHADVGYHNIVHLLVQTSITALANAGCLYTKDVGGKAELHFKDEDDNEIQLTSAGVILNTLNNIGFRTGDMLLSSNVNTPTGWTDVTTTYNGKFIRISTGAALSTGGADTHIHGAGSFAGPSHTHGAGTLYFACPVSLAGGCCGGGPAATPGQNETLDGGATAADGTGAITGSSASGDNVPVYVQMKMYKKD